MKVLKSKYITAKIGGFGNTHFLNQEELEEGKQGYIYVPYIIGTHTEESLKEYNEFMAEYHKKHAVCPKCGSDKYVTTLMGYMLDSNKKEEYKDLNGCVCVKCGDVHTAHEMISIEEFKNIS